MSATESAARYWGVVPAAGSGSRMGEGKPKQYLLLAGVPILQRTLDAMLGWPFLEQVVVALAKSDSHWQTLPMAGDSRVVTALGGAERGDSVLACLEELKDRAAPDDWVLVHDAARPCISNAAANRLVAELAADEVGGLLAVPVAETVKRADGESRVVETVDRQRLWLAQTPQMFRFGLLLAALQQAAAEAVTVTDEASAMELAGHRPRLVQGEASNIKITRPGDLWLAERCLEEREVCE